MDKDHIVAIAARGEAIKTNSTEFLWVCRGIKPPVLPPDKPLPSDAAVSPLQSQPRPLNSGGRHFPARTARCSPHLRVAPRNNSPTELGMGTKNNGIIK